MNECDEYEPIDFDDPSDDLPPEDES